MNITDEHGQRLVIEMSKNHGDWKPQAPTSVIVDLFRAATDHDGNKPVLTYHGEDNIRWRARKAERFYVVDGNILDRENAERRMGPWDNEAAQELADMLNESADRIPT